MKLSNIILITTLMSAANVSADNPPSLKDDNSRINYSVGYQVGSDFRIQEFELRPDAVMMGIKDALSGADPKMTKQEMKKAVGELGKKVVERKKKLRELIENSAEAGQKFRDDYSKKPGVITTDSGLQYRIIEESSGARPGPTDKVLVHYRGRLVDGTEFDSSYKRNRPASFRVNQVIKGWTEALKLMPRGSKWQLVIPPELGYGERGAGNTIPPNSTLIFDVELISFQ
jgi:FKBP-type peptidyl-prolyl cis-trans isomerase FklB